MSRQQWSRSNKSCFLVALCRAAWMPTSIASMQNTRRNETIGAKNAHPMECGSRDSEWSITYGPSIACSVCVIVGFFLITFGFKYRRISLFSVGFSGGALLAYLICVLRSRLGIGFVLLITAVVALLIGSLCAILISFGLVAVGLAAGVCLSLAFLLPFSILYEYNIIYIPVGVLLGTSIVMAGTTVWQKRVFLIVSSSLYGGALIMGSVDYFVENFWLLDYTWRKVFLVQYRGEPCLFSWIVLGIWPLMVIIGLIVQFLKTGTDPRKLDNADSLGNLSLVDRRLLDQPLGNDRPLVDDMYGVGMALLPTESPPRHPSGSPNTTLASLLDQIHSRRADALGQATDCTLLVRVLYGGREVERLELTSQEAELGVHFDTANPCTTGGQPSVKRYSRILDEPVAGRQVLLPDTCSLEIQEVLEHVSRGFTLQMSEDGDIYVSRLCRAQVFSTNGTKEAVRLHREEKSRVFDYQSEFLLELQMCTLEDSPPPSPDVTISVERADGSLVSIVVTHLLAKKQVDQAFCSEEELQSESVY